MKRGIERGSSGPGKTLRHQLIVKAGKIQRPNSKRDQASLRSSVQGINAESPSDLGAAAPPGSKFVKFRKNRNPVAVQTDSPDSRPVRNNRYSSSLVVEQPSENQKCRLDLGTVKLLNQLPGKKWFEIQISGVATERSTKEVKHKTTGSVKSVTLSSRSAAVAFMKKEAMEIASLLPGYLDAQHEHSSTDFKWIKNVLTVGTAGDKLAAYVLLIQQCSIGRHQHLTALSKLSLKSNRRQVSLVSEALKDLFINDLLPTDRKLHFFEDNPATSRLIEVVGDETSTSSGVIVRKGDIRRQKNAGAATAPPQFIVSWSDPELLLIWFEDFLKTLYASFVLVLECSTRDVLPFVKRNALKFSFELLVACPEQEKANLVIITDMLIDPIPKHAGAAVYYLSQIANEHPAMRPVICQRVGKLCLEKLSGGATSAAEVCSLYRPALFLSEIKYKRSDQAFAKMMADLFLSLFHHLVALFDKASQNTRHATARKRKLFKRKKLAAKKQETVGNDTSRKVVTEKLPSTSNQISPNIRLLKVILNGLHRTFKFVAADNMPQLLDEDLKVLHGMVRRVDSCSLKVAIFVVLYRVLTMTQREKDSFVQLLYNEIRSFALVQAASSRRTFSALVQEVVKTDSSGSLSLLRRFEQAALHVDAPVLQLQIAADLLTHLSTRASWADPLFTTTEASLLADDEDEVFRDVVVVEDLNGGANTEQFSNLPGMRDCPTVAVVDKRISPVTAQNRFYDPSSSDPLKACSDLSRIWEMNFLACSVNPSVATFGHVASSWRPRTERLNINRHLRKAVPFEKCKAGKLDVLKDTMSSYLILELLSYRGEKNSSSLSGSSEVNTPEYWDSKKRLYPYEKFMAQYFQDAYVRRHSTRKAAAEDVNDVDVADRYNEEVDKFLDDVLAKELGILDDDCDDDMPDILDTSVGSDHDDELGDEEGSGVEYDEESQIENNHGCNFSDMEDEVQPAPVLSKKKAKLHPAVQRANASGTFAALEDFADLIVD